MDKVILVDAKNFAYRHHHTHRLLMSKGRPTSILYGVLSGLVSLSRKFGGAPLVFVWDGAGTTWRHELSKEYKANRKGHKDPEVQKMHCQLPLLSKVLRRIGVRQFVMDNIEADDLIGILATTVIEKDLFKQVHVYSNDKDFFQLHSDRIRIVRRDKDKDVLVTPDYVQKKYGVPLAHWLTYRAVTGDESDHIKGAKRGVGPKRAIKLIAEGLDAGVPSYDLLSKKQKAAFGIFADAWPKLHENFILSHIIRSPVHDMLPQNISCYLRDLVAPLKRKSFFASEAKRTDENFKWLTHFLLDYDMLELMSKRRALWKLG
jgi:5'-3' exonuclease